MRFTVLGEVGAVGPDGPVKLGGKLRRLLAGLLASRNGEVSRNDLIDVIWGAPSEPSDAEGTLRLYVSRLRRALESAEPGAGGLLATTPSGYRLTIAHGLVDSDTLATPTLLATIDPAEANELLQLRPFGVYAEEPWCFPAAERIDAYATEAREQLRARSSRRPPTSERSDGGVHGRLDLWPERERFVGRRNEIDLIVASLTTDRLVTIVGPGGIGKTRLAVQVCHDLVPVFEHGVWFCDLSGVTEDAAASHAIASSLGISEHRGATIGESIAAGLANDRLLLVLDNCEQVSESIARLLDALLASCPELVVLATSRKPIEARVESLIRLGPVPEDDAVTLYRDRARHERPEVDEPSRLPEVVLVCKLAGGMPLAIELAASRAGLLPPAELVENLPNRPELLADRHGPRPTRHRTMAAAIEGSLAGLDQDLRLLISALSGFAGGFTLPAVHHISEVLTPAHRRDLIDDLESLVRRSLIRVSVQHDGSARYSLLEPIRQHVASGLDPGIHHRVASSHADWFASRAHGLQEQLLSRQEEAAGRDIDADFANFRAAHAWALTNNISLATKLVSGLLHCMISRLRLEICDWFEATLTRLPANDPLRHEVTAGATGGWAQRGEWEKILEADRTVDRALVRPFTRHNLDLMIAQVRYRGAERFTALETVARDANEDGDLFITSFVLGRIGRAEQALRIAERSGNPTGLAWANLAVGHQAATTRNWPEALERFGDAITIARTVDAYLPLARSLAWWATVGRRTRAEPALTTGAARESERILRRCGATGTLRELTGQLQDIERPWAQEA